LNQPKLIVDYALEHATRQPDRVFLTQPVGGGKVVDLTWGETLDEARRMAAHLRSLGFPPGARIAILSKNCAHFIVAELAIWLAGHTTVAIFPTETAGTVRFVLEHSEASLLFVGKLDIWKQQQAGVPEGLPCIALPLAPPTDFESWDAIVARTPPLPEPSRRTADELAMLLYTSGSTGQPKGVMTSFGAITRAAEGIRAEVRRHLSPGVEGRLLSYLPLAHALERAWVEGASLVDGGNRIYFAESLDTFVDDLRRARPTLFMSVPRLWLKFQQGVFARLPPARLDRLLGIPWLGRRVGRKVLAGLGLDHVTLAGSGSAPIPAELILWYRRLGLRLYEGYAMTEDTAYSHTSSEGLNAPGYVGAPLPGVEVRLSPDGEILIKSPGQFSGYYKQPELTAASFTEDGFFRTGDLGECRPDGLLKITGRAKELFKTDKGKYVAPAPIENRLNVHPMIELSLVSGVGRPAAYGLVVLAEDVRARVGDAEFRRRVEDELAALLQQVNGELADYERVRMLVVVPEPWTIEDGCLTPTMKVRRAAIEARVASQLDAWYASDRPVLWMQTVRE
jgi:long-subunit acyl-CoA synthetase (AMP-forming)